MDEDSLVEFIESYDFSLEPLEFVQNRQDPDFVWVVQGREVLGQVGYFKAKQAAQDKFSLSDHLYISSEGEFFPSRRRYIACQGEVFAALMGEIQSIANQNSLIQDKFDEVQGLHSKPWTNFLRGLIRRIYGKQK